MTWVVVVLVLIGLGVGGPYVYLHMVSAHNPPAQSFSDLATTSTGPAKPTVMPAEPSTPAAALPPAATSTPQSAPPTTDVALTTTPPPVAPTPAPPAPAPTTAPAPPPALAPTTVASPIAGDWTVGAGTDARWSTDDTLLGQTTRIIGRTNDVSGSLHIDALTITSAQLAVNMQTALCNCMHDPAYNEMLETSKFPTAKFTLTAPITFPSVPAAGAISDVPATGEFTIHGVTRTVTFDFQTTEVGNRLAFKATIPVDPSDYAIQPPVSNNPMGSIGNTDIELLIAFDRS
ncbi:YceI family protein [Nocardia sp. NPDC059240]|uniref:YceI family protein n=1 Tax=Nocardia sp. NPDC059240 TaxID=3346786 RepID=UPI0036993C3E